MRHTISTKATRAVTAGATAACTLVAFAALGGVAFAKSSVGLGQYQYGDGMKVTLCHKDKNTALASAPRQSPRIALTAINSERARRCAAEAAEPRREGGEGEGGEGEGGEGEGREQKAAREGKAGEADKAAAAQAKADKARARPRSPRAHRAVGRAAPADKGNRGGNGKGKGKG